MGKKLILALALLLIALFFFFDLERYLTLPSLKENRSLLLAFHAAHPFWTVALFMGIYIVQTALSLPGAAILSLTAGAVFGTLAGTLFATVAATIGAALAFLATRYLFHSYVERRLHGKLARLNEELEARGLNYLLFLRLIPLFPFFLVNLAAGLTRLPLKTFIIGTVVGIIPGGFVYCNAGASLAAIDSLHDVASPRTLGAFALLGLTSLVPVLYQKFRR